jgi:hypothetical protein
VDVVRETVKQDHRPSVGIALFDIGDVKQFGCDMFQHGAEGYLFWSDSTNQKNCRIASEKLSQDVMAFAAILHRAAPAPRWGLDSPVPFKIRGRRLSLSHPGHSRFALIMETR